jgi:hypothetical protein
MIPLCRLASGVLADPILCQAGGWSARSVREDGCADEAVVGDEVQVSGSRDEIGSRAQIGGMEFEMADRGIVRRFTAQCEAVAVRTWLRCAGGWLLVWRAPACGVVVACVALHASRSRDRRRSLQEIERPPVESRFWERWENRG